MSNVTSIQEVAAALEAARNPSAGARPLYVYTVPPAIAAVTGVTHVGLVELTPGEMLTAQRRGGGDQGATLFEMIKESWRRVNDRAIHTGDGSADLEWGKDAPGYSKLRTLLATAYNSIHNPTPTENGAFLATQTVTVGK
jgi:hypothetical protein